MIETMKKEFTKREEEEEKKIDKNMLKEICNGN